MKRRVRVFNKVRLLECSVVGIPAYPDAHYSQDEFSLIKSLSLSEGNEELNLNMETNMDEVEKSTTETLEKSEKDVSIEKTEDMSDKIAKAIVAGLKEGFDKLATQRGLEQTAKPERVKSIGEQAVELGLFAKPL